MKKLHEEQWSVFEVQFQQDIGRFVCNIAQSLGVRIERRDKRRKGKREYFLFTESKSACEHIHSDSFSCKEIPQDRS